MRAFERVSECPGYGARRASQGWRGRERGAQGKRQRPSPPGADGDSERPVLEAKALPLALLGNVAAEHPGASRLERWSLLGPTGVRRKWDPTARVVRHIPMTEATYRSLGQVLHHPLSKLHNLILNVLS